MNSAEIKAQIQAFSESLQLLTRHASMCSEAHSLTMDLTTSLNRRIDELRQAEVELSAKRKAKTDG